MTAPTVKDLLLAPELSVRQVTELLKPYGFQDIKKADTNLQMIADEPSVRTRFAGVLDEFLSCLAESADPDQALNHFERFSRAAFSKTALFSYLQESPRTISLLAKVFGGSPFLSEILIRNPEYFYWVFDPATRADARKKEEISRELSGALRLVKTKEDQLNLLRIYKRKEILHIGVRDLLRESSVEETLRALSDLAEVLIQNACAFCEKALRRKVGAPAYQKKRGRQDGTLRLSARRGFTVLALGKLGGRELNFSSDVDLIYLYASSAGRTAGADGVSNAEYFKRLAQEVTAALNARTEQGYVYRVDLRLRPEGEMGLIAQPLQGYRRYYRARGETWERLSLIKARPVAGDPALGKAFLKMASPFVYDKPFGAKGRREIKALKDKIDEKIAEGAQTKRHVKLGYGGIREIEFIVQTLQLELGRKKVEARERNTLRTLRKLARNGALSPEARRRLSAAYLFLRDVENKLQMAHDLQTHLLPTEPAEFRRLALRLGYRDGVGSPAPDQLTRDYRFHTETVHALFQELFETPEGLRK